MDLFIVMIIGWLLEGNYRWVAGFICGGIIIGVWAHYVNTARREDLTALSLLAGREANDPIGATCRREETG
jgi:hypothetical protein